MRVIDDAPMHGVGISIQIVLRQLRASYEQISEPQGPETEPINVWENPNFRCDHDRVRRRSAGIGNNHMAVVSSQTFLTVHKRSRNLQLFPGPKFTHGFSYLSELPVILLVSCS